MSFSTGGLFVQHSIVVAKVFMKLNDWSLVNSNVIEENLLQSKKISSAKREYSEISSRLKLLNKDELEYLIDSDFREQTLLLWVAVCRRYQFIAEFAIEVLHERYVTLKADVTQAEFESFYYQKEEWHPELEGITPGTRNKLRQVLFKMMKEAEILTKNNLINGVVMSSELAKLIAKNNIQELMYFPIFESDLKSMIE